MPSHTHSQDKPRHLNPMPKHLEKTFDKIFHQLSGPLNEAIHALDDAPDELFECRVNEIGDGLLSAAIKSSTISDDVIIKIATIAPSSASLLTSHDVLPLHWCLYSDKSADLTIAVMNAYPGAVTVPGQFGSLPVEFEKAGKNRPSVVTAFEDALKQRERSGSSVMKTGRRFSKFFKKGASVMKVPKYVI